MLKDILQSIQMKKPPSEWKVNGYSIGDGFGSIVNENPLYVDSKAIKVHKRARYYRDGNSEIIGGISFGVLSGNEKTLVLDSIQSSFGKPYFSHLQMNDKILYYPALQLYLRIIGNDISKGLTVIVGKCGTQLRTFTALNIIDAYFDLSHNGNLVTRLEDLSNLPKVTQLSYRTLESLLLVFVGDSSIAKFSSGNFILASDDKYLEKVLNRIGGIEIYETPKRIKTTLIDRPNRYELSKYWQKLFRYYLNSRSYIERTRQFNFTNWEKIDLREVKLVSSYSATNAKMTRLGEMISQIIDPEDRRYDLKDMIQAYGYPKEDIAWLKVNDYY